MQAKKLLFFLFQAIVVGLAAVVILMFMRPDIFTSSTPVVEVRHSAAPPVSPRPGDGPVSYSAAVEQAAPAVVNVYTAKVVREQTDPFFNSPLLRRFFGDSVSGIPRKRLDTSLGSGVILSEQGYLLTNNHVIDGADQIQIALRDGRTARAEVVGTDPESDLAVLKINLDKLPSITVGNSDQLHTGDVVLAIGNPFGVGQTVTLGIVSATGRNQLGINTYENFIQTDAAINPGNSGGALVTARGELVGINTAIFSRSGGSQGIGFAIPVSLATEVMWNIIKHGRVIRGWLGIEAQNLTPALAESFRIMNIKGVLVTAVLRNGPADQAGLKPGDVITHINDQPVSFAKQAMNIIAEIDPGGDSSLRVIRNGGARTLTAKVIERPPLIRQREAAGR